KVPMHMELIIRFDYGQIVPWVRKGHGGLEAIAGPDGLILRTPIETRGRDLTTVAEFTVSEGEKVPFVLTWFASHKNPPRAIHPDHALRDTEKYWRAWSEQFRGQGEWRDAVMRSLIVLKGLTYAPTGGLVAAATTSLPEQIGGPRNWDYRYVWLRDATSNQFQLDVYGEVLAAMWQADRLGIKLEEPDWALMVQLMKFLESNWQKPDEGIWEVRGGRKNFTHSKVMAWLAFDRAVKLV